MVTVSRVSADSSSGTERSESSGCIGRSNVILQVSAVELIALLFMEAHFSRDGPSEQIRQNDGSIANHLFIMPLLSVSSCRWRIF